MNLFYALVTGVDEKCLKSEKSKADPTPKYNPMVGSGIDRMKKFESNIQTIVQRIMN